MKTKEEILQLIQKQTTPKDAWDTLITAGVIPSDARARTFIQRDPDLCNECNGTGLNGVGYYCYACDGAWSPEFLRAEHPWTIEDVISFAHRWQDVPEAENAAHELAVRLRVPIKPIVWQRFDWSTRSGLPLWAWGLIYDLTQLSPGVIPRNDPNRKDNPYASFPGWIDLAEKGWAAAVALGDAGVIKSIGGQSAASLPNPLEPARRLARMSCTLSIFREDDLILHFHSSIHDKEKVESSLESKRDE
jgi:hypothetical protein